jgi:hypothetical protein
LSLLAPSKSFPICMAEIYLEGSSLISPKSLTRDTGS